MTLHGASVSIFRCTFTQDQTTGSVELGLRNSGSYRLNQLRYNSFFSSATCS